MFTGIVQEIGTVLRTQRDRGVMRLTIQAPQTAARVQPMESIAVHGVCLSAVSVREPSIVFEVIGETQQVTTLGRLRQGSRVNVEPSLTLTDRLNGHITLGHVDGTAVVTRRRELPKELVLTFRIDGRLRPWLVPKGPVAVDGVSLTVGRHVTRSTFSIHLIPETLRRTTLRALRVGDRVNVEVDYLTKVVCSRWTASSS